MTTQVQPRTDKMVRLALQADGVVCTLAGGAFVLGAGALSPLLGVESPLLLLFGVVTLVYGLAVLYFANRPTIDPRVPMATVTINIVLVALCIFLLVADPLTLTDPGKWVTLMLLDSVAIFGIRSKWLWRSFVCRMCKYFRWFTTILLFLRNTAWPLASPSGPNLLNGPLRHPFPNHPNRHQQQGRDGGQLKADGR